MLLYMQMYSNYTKYIPKPPGPPIKHPWLRHCGGFLRASEERAKRSEQLSEIEGLGHRVR